MQFLGYSLYATQAYAYCGAKACVGTVESVFANIRHNRRFGPFQLWGHEKANMQWNILYCTVHMH